MGPTFAQEFEAEMHEHAQVLRDAPFGEALIWSCGYVYESKGLQVRAALATTHARRARLVLGCCRCQALGGIDGISSEFRVQGHEAASKLRVASSALRTYRAFRKEGNKLASAGEGL